MKIKATILACMMAFPVFSQKVEKCDQLNKSKQILKNASSQELKRIKDAEFTLEQAAKDLNNASSASRAKADGIMKIPMVFHIVHQGGEENISDEQIKESIVQVNEDFNARNQGLADVETEFQNIIANVGFEFYLAKRDPQGKPTTGINRIYTTLSSNGQNQEIQDLISWPREKYLNIWVVTSSDGGSGSAYAYIPSTVIDRPLIDGVTTSHWAVGRTGTARWTHYKILTHEIGHWANLEHCWGNAERFSGAACNVDDGVADTPLTYGNGGCGAQSSCGSKDNYQNFMDYANCSVMFTEGQKNRMRAALNSDISGRNNLHTTQNLIETGILDAPALAIFDQSSDIVKPGNSITFTDQSISETGANITTWKWEFPGSDTPEFSGQTPPQIVYNEVGSYDVKLTVTNNLGESHTRTISDAVVVENFFAMSNSTVSVCEGTFYDSGLRSPHENNEDYVMTFTPEDDTKKLEFDFISFNLEKDDGECFDYLEIFNGPDVNSPSLGLYCDNNAPKSVIANNSSGSITFRFHSDDNSYSPGWKANIICRDKDYISTDIIMGTKSVTSCDGTFFDSGKNTNYSDSENSTLTIYPEGSQNKVKVEFLEFELEMGEQCDYDFLTIHDGENQGAPIIGRYCGKNSPGSILATNASGALTFHFESDGNTNFPGWKANVSCITPDDVVALFGSDKKSTCENSSIKFENKSIGTVESVKWNFEGGSPETSTEAHPTVIYPTSGSYKVELIVFKEDKSDTISIENYIRVDELQSLPLNLDFENNESIANWEVINPDSGLKWEINNTTGFNSSSSLVMNNAANAIVGEIDEIISPPLNFTKAGEFIEFQLAYTKFNDFSPDVLKFFISTDCGLSWEEVYSKTHTELQTKEVPQGESNDWVPSSANGDWRKEQIDISQFKGQGSVMLKIQNVSGYGTRIWLDDLKIEATDNDVVLGTPNTLKDYKLYPNPTNRIINIDGMNDEIKNAKVYSSVGSEVTSVVKTQNKNSLKIDFNNVREGIYIVVIETASGSFTEKIILKK
ncbi:CUB domain-containing protein [Aureibacter tunicatorum]|uniref:PKD repeat protein n=1 Tax=Aureibacter tunicatorum TaxID=866807 RepID=A0AAE3XNR7_9BACT|nr:CUB domain-containing protein [Aureibacter tunicatorum]MDR6239885.1 PKD repeat protein [Aureibacter tunicatorum]BDD04360.1 hypothetical protein AUTU_18430 [Aureibacter tunicatorum]